MTPEKLKRKSLLSAAASVDSATAGALLAVDRLHGDHAVADAFLDAVAIGKGVPRHFLEPVSGPDAEEYVRMVTGRMRSPAHAPPLVLGPEWENVLRGFSPRGVDAFTYPVSAIPVTSITFDASPLAKLAPLASGEDTGINGPPPMRPTFAEFIRLTHTLLTKDDAHALPFPEYLGRFAEHVEGGGRLFVSLPPCRDRSARRAVEASEHRAEVAQAEPFDASRDTLLREPFASQLRPDLMDLPEPVTVRMVPGRGCGVTATSTDVFRAAGMTPVQSGGTPAPRPTKPPPRRSKRASGKFDGLVEWLSQRYGPELGPFLARRLAKSIRRVKDECLDNFRACDTASVDEVARYERQRASGCCGVEDIEVTHFASGRTFRMGFNYGH